MRRNAQMAITQRGVCIEHSGFAFKQCGLCCIAEASVAEQSAFRQGCLCCIAEAVLIIAEASHLRPRHPYPYYSRFNTGCFS